MKRLLAASAIALLSASLAACDAFPPYRQMQAEARARANITEQHAEGQAQLQKAESSRRVRVLDAQARLDSARMTAEAEVIRAQGVAQANKILSDSLGGPEGYLRWKYIEMLEEKQGATSTIYIPTEAGVPILEAGKR